MTPESRQAIESILMVADQPVEPSVLAQLLEVPKAEIEAACQELADEYEANGRGFILAQVAGGYRFQSHPDLAPYVERFVLDGQTSRLSSAALETLAIVAYKQPISRMQIAAIRGVNVDGVLRTLQQRGYVDEAGRDPGPGNAVLFGTTSLFLERVGLNSLDDLPALADFVPGADVVEALEEGLRPEPIAGLAAEAAAVAEVVDSTNAEDADNDSAAACEPESESTEPLGATDSAEPADDTDAAEPLGATDDVVPVEGAEPAESQASEPLGDGHADDPADARADDPADEPADSPGHELIDLTTGVGSERARRVQDLTSPITSTIRHTHQPPLEASGQDESFRTAPGARTGGEDVEDTTLGEADEGVDASTYRSSGAKDPQD